jgi:hypothetical protein
MFTVVVGFALLAASSTLAGCTSSERAAPASQAGGTAPADQPPSSYQDRLNRMDQRLGDALALMRRSRDPDTLEQATLAAASVASSESEQTRADPGDAAVTQANTALADSLNVFAQELGYLSQQVHEHEICTGPSVMDMVATAPSMPALRAVSNGLALPGANGRTYRWGSSLPARPANLSRPPVQVVNGAIVIDHRPPGGGDGALELRNDSTDGAVVMLSSAGVLLLAVAVAAGRSTTVDGIPDGDYELDYTSGSDWDANLGAFGRNCTFRRFTDPASFRTTPAQGGVSYTVRTVVINSGPADAQTADIPPGQLPRG